MGNQEKQRDFIKNFSQILEFFRLVFFYGSYTREDYRKIGISSSRYYQYRHNLQAVLGDALIDLPLDSGGQAVAFHKDMFSAPYHAILALYSIKSFTEKQLFTSLAVMQIIGQQ